MNLKNVGGYLIRNFWGLVALCFFVGTFFATADAGATQHKKPMRKVASADVHNYSEIAIDWAAIKKESNVGDGLGCMIEGNYGNTVVFHVPGEKGKDFNIEAVGVAQGAKCNSKDDCCEVAHGMANGVYTSVFTGSCASDNDENFTIRQLKGEKLTAHVTIDAGC